MPSFFGKQAIRLQRKFETVQQLADELYSMFGSEVPMETDQQVIIHRNDENSPGIQIIDNTDGTSSPIQIIRKKGDDVPTPAMDPGGFDCCSDGGGGGGGGGGGSGGRPPIPSAGSPSTGGPVSLAQPPVGAFYRVFSGEVIVSVSKDGPDPSGFNGQTTAFSGAACLPYNPPTIPAPTSALSIPDIGRQMDSFASRWQVGLTVISDRVSGPGRKCTPDERFDSSLVGLPGLPET
jgi:hypothetical protein